MVRPPHRRRAAQWATLVASAAGLLLATPAVAQVVLTANSAASLVSALTTVDLNPGTHYEINITSNINLTAGTALPAINTTSRLVINGNNFMVNGGGVQQGLFVYAGKLAINNLANHQCSGRRRRQLRRRSGRRRHGRGRCPVCCQRRQRHGQQCQLVEQ